jgi:hypothetical protein
MTFAICPCQPSNKPWLVDRGTARGGEGSMR